MKTERWLADVMSATWWIYRVELARPWTVENGKTGRGKWREVWKGHWVMDAIRVVYTTYLGKLASLRAVPIEKSVQKKGGKGESCCWEMTLEYWRCTCNMEVMSSEVILITKSKYWNNYLRGGVKIQSGERTLCERYTEFNMESISSEASSMSMHPGLRKLIMLHDDNRSSKIDAPILFVRPHLSPN